MLTPLEEIRDLIIRQQYLMKKHNITESDIYDIEYYLKELDWQFNQTKIMMNEEIKKFPIYLLNSSGELVRIYSIKSTEDYNHFYFHLHHYIQKQDYYRNQDWYIKNGIEQKLILLRIPIHEQLHYNAVKNLSEQEFTDKYGIERCQLVYKKN